MASFQKFNSFTKALAEKTHNLASDAFKVLLTNTAPVATNTQKTDLTEISAGNGYTAGGGSLTVSSSTQSSGTYKWVVADFTFTASGGSIGPFRYAVIYNNTATNKELIGFYDYSSSLTLNAGESLTIDFDNTNGILQLV